MPLIASKANAAAGAFGFASLASADKYFVSWWSNGTETLAGRAVTTTPTNIFHIAQNGVSGVSKPGFYKFSSDGSVRTYHYNTNANWYGEYFDVVELDNGNIASVGEFVAANYNSPTLTIHNTTPAIVSSVSYTGTQHGSFRSVSKSAYQSNYVLCGGDFQLGGTSGRQGLFAVYDTTSNTFIGHNTLVRSSYVGETVVGIKQISDGTIYTITTGPASFLSTWEAFLSKWNASLQHQWSYYWSSGVQFDISDTAFDSSDSFYLCGYDYSTSPNVGYVMKATNNGSTPSISFVARLKNPTYAVEARGMTVDSNNNVYVAYSCGDNKSYLVKFNSSGTLQWQRSIQFDAGTYFTPGKIEVKNDVLYFCGYSLISSTWYSTIMAFPTDGSATGSWNVNGITVTYAVSTALSTHSASNGTLTSFTPTFPTRTSTNTSTGLSLVSYTPTSDGRSKIP